MSSSMHYPVESNSIEKKCWGYYVDVKFHVDSISATFSIVFQRHLDDIRVQTFCGSYPEAQLRDNYKWAPKS